MEELETLATFDNLISADLVKERLESCGIECFLEGEYSLNLFVGAQYVKLKVKISDVEKAREVMDSADIISDG